MKPYEPRILPLDDIDWASHVTLIGKANAALARYDGILQGIVNPKVLLSPLTTREAVLSSKIEGTQVSLEDVLQYEADIKEPFKAEREQDIHEVLNYRKAMGHAVNELKDHPLSIDMIRDLHRILLSDVRGNNRWPGEIRRIQNYIGRPGSPIEKAIFVPPAPSRVMDALSNWEQYLHSEEKDPLVQLSVLKAQFELIHPFSDGNGRIGRMLVPLILYNKKMLSSPMFYISAYLERNRDIYYERLLGISRDNDWNGWISFFLQAIQEQADENSSKAWSILELYKEMKSKVPEIVPSKHAVYVIDAIFSRPIFKTSQFVPVAGSNRMAAQRILRALTENGILDIMAEGRGRQPTVYSFRQLLDITEKL
ncbi:Fic family protein [Methanocella arvoryzae]|uniref:Predicted cell division protein (Fic family) n=1 Tax=Methanocella arvoryzae (strain DSM 22066 / NBRC 105507 / MRE50) TaxID=351160 RepID=Q0W4B3_METAR|nr:Fic/DOC family N-terminal domain-containing protein [Methanocella arvoryzae]CAJ36780.1 predicted cell division protein (Fic family) [Methanocella arvoryzae MRE50]